MTLFNNCSLILWNITLQDHFLKLLARGFLLLNTNSKNPSSLMYRSCFCQCDGQLTGPVAATRMLSSYLWATFFPFTWALTTFAVSLLYSKDLQTSFALQNSLPFLATVFIDCTLTLELKIKTLALPGNTQSAYLLSFKQYSSLHVWGGKRSSNGVLMSYDLLLRNDIKFLHLTLYRPDIESNSDISSGVLGTFSLV